MGGGLRPGSPAPGLYLFLVGLTLVLLGFEPGALDRRLDFIGRLIFEAMPAVILIWYAVIVGAGLHSDLRPGRNALRLGWMIGVAGWFCWAGSVNPL